MYITCVYTRRHAVPDFIYIENNASDVVKSPKVKAIVNKARTVAKKHFAQYCVK